MHDVAVPESAVAVAQVQICRSALRRSVAPVGEASRGGVEDSVTKVISTAECRACCPAKRSWRVVTWYG